MFIAIAGALKPLHRVKILSNYDFIGDSISLVPSAPKVDEE